jgi:hypothetical protein
MMKKLIGTGLGVAMAAAFAYAVSSEAEATPAVDTTVAVDVPAGPIWNNDHAKQVCPAVCTAAGGHWNGNWRTVIWGKSSVCGCD